jgi:uncharacterized protein (TIGR02145 family)
MKNTHLLFIVLSLALCSCNSEGTNQQDKPKGAVAPIALSSVKIGTQEWQNKNLDVVTFRNGDTIPEIKSNEDWMRAGSQGRPAWCYYNNDSAYGRKFGKLYNWYAVKDARGLAPAGWHVPTADEWKLMTDYLSNNNEAGYKLKAKDVWNPEAQGSDSVGFTALPAGCRYSEGAFYSLEQITDWWTSTEGDSTNTAVYKGIGPAKRVANAVGSKSYGLGIRLVRDK